MLNLPDLDGILDLWGAAWEPGELNTLEQAIIRPLGDETRRRSVRLNSLSACHVLDTPRLKQALTDAWGSGAFSLEELLDHQREALPLRQLVHEAEQLRGNLAALEALCRPASANVPSLDALLDLVDVRDLVALLQRHLADEEIRGEATRRLLKRGPRQRQRVRETFPAASARQSAGDREPYAEYALELG
jgi:hypothetical protein